MSFLKKLFGFGKTVEEIVIENHASRIESESISEVGEQEEEAFQESFVEVTEKTPAIVAEVIGPAEPSPDISSQPLRYPTAYELMIKRNRQSKSLLQRVGERNRKNRNLARKYQRAM